MFITDLADPVTPEEKQVHEKLERLLGPVVRVQPERRAFLAWAEHCHECAMPACFETCDQYEPRRLDRRCRRFARGLRSLADHGIHADRPGAVAEFKTWGKLETPGNFTLRDEASLAWRERAYERMRPWLRGLSRVAGPLIRYPGIVNVAFTHALTSCARRRARAHSPMPPRFCLEIANLSEEPSRLQLKMQWSDRPPFQFSTWLLPGYNRKDILPETLKPWIHDGEPFLIQLAPDGDRGAHWAVLTADFVDLGGGDPVVSGPAHGKPVKCVVFDLDRTLWDGILLEGDDVRLRPGVESMLQELDRRGVILGIASKNEETAALEKLKHLGIDRYFVCPQISWSPKSESLRRLRDELNIGADTIVFVDDQPFERAEVENALPEIRVVDERALDGLLANPLFEGDLSGGSIDRRRKYTAEVERKTHRRELGEAGFVSFLADCAIELTIDRPAPTDHDRVHQLIQRTNQLNFTGHRFTREQIETMLADPSSDVFVLHASDRFGDYGLVGFCRAEHDADAREARIDEMTFSCRIQAKTIDTAFIGAVIGHYFAAGVDRVRVQYVETDRNGHVGAMLDSFGFDASEDGWRTFTPDRPLPDARHLRLRWGASVPAVAV